ncbi:Phosphatidylinositol-3-phosphatase SAC1 [Savitreella phatthalungensis]
MASGSGRRIKGSASPNAHSHRFSDSERQDDLRDNRDYRRNDRPRYRSRSPRRRHASPYHRTSVTHQHRAVTPEDDGARDARTIFVQQLAARLRTKELIAFFEQAGRVRDAQIVKDRVSGRSKGVGYVEFEQPESVPLGLALTGQRLLGIPVIAQLTEAEKNRLAKQEAQRVGRATLPRSHGKPFHRLYVGNIHFSIGEDDIRAIFEGFGPLVSVTLTRDQETGRSRGYGFIHFQDADHAKQALEQMNGHELVGRPIRVGLGSAETPEPQDTSSPSAAQARQADAQTCLLLRNMFDPREESGDSWQKELEEDVTAECEEKYGIVRGCHVDKDSVGHIYMCFEHADGARKALTGLHGRLFGGRSIVAEALEQETYDKRFSA